VSRATRRPLIFRQTSRRERSPVYKNASPMQLSWASCEPPASRSISRKWSGPAIHKPLVRDWNRPARWPPSSRASGWVWRPRWPKCSTWDGSVKRLSSRCTLPCEPPVCDSKHARIERVSLVGAGVSGPLPAVLLSSGGKGITPVPMDSKAETFLRRNDLQGVCTTRRPLASQRTRGSERPSGLCVG